MAAAKRENLPLPHVEAEAQGLQHSAYKLEVSAKSRLFAANKEGIAAFFRSVAFGKQLHF